MARRDRLKQGSDAKDRVIQRLSEGTGSQTAAAPSRRRDRLKSEEQRAQETRSLAPELFNPQAQLSAAQRFVAPPPPVSTPSPVPTSLPTFQQQIQNINTLAPKRESRQEWIERKANEREEWRDEHPGWSGIDRLFEPVTKGLDYVQAYTPGLSSFQRGAGNALGVGDVVNRNAAPVTGNRIVNSAADLVGNVAGLASVPGSGLGKSQLTAPIEVGQRAGTLARNPIASRAIEGVVAGAIGGASGSAASGQTDFRDVAENAALGAGLGLVGEAFAGGISKALSQRLRKNNIPEEVAQDILALPAPRQRGNVNAAVADDVITPEYQFALPEPKVAKPTTARTAQQVNPYREQFENLIRRAQQLQDEGLFTPGREDLELENLWSQMAGREGVSLDELIQRAYPTRKSRLSTDLVGKARDYQAAREVAGAPLPVKSLDDRLEPQGVLGDVAAPQTVPARAPGAPVNRPRIDITEEVDRAIPSRKMPNAGDSADEVLEKAKEPRVRDRLYSFLDEQEQAARQRIAKRRGYLNSSPLPEWGDMAIIGAAKLGKGTIKAADWTEEMVKEFGEQFRPVAQRVYNASKEHLRTQERRASKEGMEADTFNNSGQGDASTFSQKVSRGAKKKQTSIDQKIEKFRSQTEDDLIALEGLEKRVKGIVGSAEDSLYKAARLFKGAPEKASLFIKDRIGPIAKAVEAQGKSIEDLGDYALAVHARDVNKAGFKSGFTNAEIDDVINKLGTPEMEAARKQLVQINKDLLKDQVAAGNVSQELADILDNRWKNYIPLFRDMESDAVGFGGGLSNALANVANPIKTLKGSERNVIDPMENMIKNIFQSVNSIERNKVAQQLSRLAKRDTDQQFIRKLDPDEKVGTKNVVTVRENGEPVKYEVEPEVYKAMLNLDQESSNMLINVLSKPASVLRAGATLTPEFSLRNPMRDVLTAYVTSKSGFNPITDFGAGLIQSIKKGPLYRDWINNLGGYGNTLSMDRNVHREALKKVLSEPQGKKFVNIINPKSWLAVLRAISDTTESATKVGEYRAAMRKGATPQEAAYRARDLMDFARAGSSIRQANKVVAFLNANIQGKSKLLRAIKENPVGTTSRMFTAVTLPTVAVYAINRLYANDFQKQTLQDAPDWQKDAFWLLAVPGTDLVARIPKPFDVAPLFANLPEKAMQYVIDKDPKAFDGFAQRSLGSLALPSQISGLLPFIEGMSNYSFFRQGPIVPQREEGLQAKDQYDPIRTTEVAKIIAAGADKLTGGKGPFKNFSSPRIVDNTIQGLTAGLGTYATSAIDSILKGLDVVDRPTSPEKRLEQKPLAKAFLVDPLQGGQSMDKFYEERERLQRQQASAKINEKPFPAAMAQRLKQLNKVSDRVSKINKQIREIESSDLTAGEKRERIEILTRDRNQLVREAAK